MSRTKWVINSYTIEIISSLFRWFFLFTGMLVFFYPPLRDIIQPDMDQVLGLIIVSFLYMFGAQVVLHSLPETSTVFKVVMRSSIVFDIVIAFWFIHSTGGVESLFLPILYLIPIHAGVYWSLRGAILSATVIAMIYGLYLGQVDYFHSDAQWLHCVVTLCFLYLVSFYGGVIIHKERNHYRKMTFYQEQANVDYLTGLYNHRYFQESLKSYVNQKKALFLILVDIDHFKKVNDRYGHQTGDEVLRNMGLLLRMSWCSKEEIQAFRYGGEEFALLVETGDIKEVKRLILGIRERLGSQWFHKDETRFQVTLSFGVTPYELGESPSQLIERADQLLYLSKRRGRNIAFYQVESQRQAKPYPPIDESQGQVNDFSN